MFFKRKNKIESEAMFERGMGKKKNGYPSRLCNVLVSTRFQEVLFIPKGKTESGIYRELDSVVAREWPLELEQLQNEIKDCLDKYVDTYRRLDNANEHWYSLKTSKAKTHRSFKVDYVTIQLTTETSRGYGEKEAERIKIEAAPIDWNSDVYRIVATQHLVGCNVAPRLIDIHKACEQIRN